jgi:hypothetical protein
MATPQVDDQLALVIGGAGGPDLAAAAEVRPEDIPHRLEPRRDESIDHRPNATDAFRR